MNKLLVVVPYKLWFCSSNTTRGLLGLQIHALESILGIVVIKFNYFGCGVGGILINDERI